MRAACTTGPVVPPLLEMWRQRCPILFMGDRMRQLPLHQRFWQLFRDETLEKQFQLWFAAHRRWVSPLPASAHALYLELLKMDVTPAGNQLCSGGHEMMLLPGSEHLLQKM